MRLSENTPNTLLPFHRLLKPYFFSSSPQAFSRGSILPGCAPIATSSDKMPLRMKSLPLSLLRPLFSLELGGEGLQDDVREEDLTDLDSSFEDL